VAHDRRLGTLSGVRVPRDLNELGPDGLELDVWLAHALLGYAARNFSMENTVRRDSMKNCGHLLNFAAALLG
jgi:hypothetical protein